MFTVELTPQTRFFLLPLFTGYKGPFANQTESKAFRSAFGKLALRPIQAAAERSGGQLSAKQVSSTAPAAFVLTFDEAQVLRAVANSRPATGTMELALGDLVDDLDSILDGSTRTETAALPLDQAAEDWSPPKVVNDVPAAD
jgi:hypothetical protein